MATDTEAITACTEENELLNANSIKMTEAPFGRSDSEDDIVEDYDDVLTMKAPCVRNRTGLEKCLMVVVFLALVVIIALAVGLARPKEIKVDEYCKTPGCIKASSEILSAMDPTVDPCTDFYRYACGGWIKQNPIPPGYHQWDRFQELSGKNLYMLKNLIEGHTLNGKAQEKVKEFYQSCMDTSTKKRRETLDDFRQLIRDVDGWSFDPKDNNNTWLFQVALEMIHRQEAWPLFKVFVDVDERNPTKRHILKIDLGETVLPADLFPSIPHPPTQKPENSTANTTTPTQQYIHPSRNVSQVKKLFVDETMHILMAFGVSEKAAESRANELLRLEVEIASATPNSAQSHDPMSLYNIMPIAELEKNYSMLSWVQYFAVLGYAVTDEDYVIVLHPHYLIRLTHIVKDYLSTQKTKEILRDYMVVSIIRSLKPYFDPNTFEVENSEEDEIVEHWKRCVFYTNKALGFATGAIYVSGSSHEGNVDKVEKLILYVKNAFKDYLLRKFWMDKVTRQKASEKIDHIIDKISYPSYILNATFLDVYYGNFKVIAGNWLQSIIEWRRFELRRSNAILKEKPDRKKSWLRPPITVNAIYSPTRNDIIFPIAMFHLPFYIPDGPNSVNFGAMGSVIGHEITHALDIQGRQYDHVGRLTDWWDPNTVTKFGVTTECMKDQYNDFKLRGFQLNGSFTLDENIADNGGIRAANFAYQMWIDEHGEEPPLPGLNLTHYQVFYLSYAQMYCSKWTDLGLLHHLLTDRHSPGFARVNGALANSKTFSWAFDCSIAAHMNSRIKCKVW